jgi:hypothetical protein
MDMTALRPSTIVCDVRAAPADAVMLDCLARLQLVARRLGSEVRLRHASPELLDLIAFAGLADVLQAEALAVEPRREPEEREQRLGVEEERELGDPPV